MTTIIVGAGLAGLTVADGLIKAGYPGTNILILEKYGYIGGRVVSGKRPDGTTYEIGAGRFHSSHVQFIKLIHRFGLQKKVQSIDGPVFWKTADMIDSHPNPFQDILSAYLPLFRSLPKHVLATSTLKEIAIQIFGKQYSEEFFMMHPYRSEIEILRADLALESDIFLSSGYLSLTGGIHQVIQRYTEYLRKKGVRIQTNTEVSNIVRVGSKYRIETKSTSKSNRSDSSNRSQISIPSADRVVFALHVNALRSLPVFKNHALLRHVQMAPLTRIYAQFPTPWKFPRTITDSSLRYIIPIQPKKGLVMISYTDSHDTVPWKGLRGPSLQKKITSEISHVFPESTVPKPSWVQSYEWKDGCSYWLPGTYDPREVGQKILCPLSKYPEVYVCGESFSMKQAWMEGAIEHANALIDRIQHQTTYVSPVA